ncbi:MAG TPA: His-Xaa-Ser system protein HxsD [Fimbriimonas sp.]|nr:His-Xaa-Ser system protein HxsD [Fimbriimonas sp.]
MSVEVRFDANSHTADAIQRAAYRFADRFSIELTQDGLDYRCLLHFATEPDAAAVDDFRTEVLDQVLRERIRAETEGARNLVLSLAFSNTHLVDDGDDPADQHTPR